ncbi:alpha-hydroxy-acid oxidizing protein [Leifsonia sp. Leaf264]|uniref:alpha-hydroxy-acid oxidizing protein n=1 Tax=Leifsonia sp. Leaf264 TaxID=1736314 RepID=UPI0006F27727|nr:alpha-hydroxy-acid oxidizing protein [Leifsonia sp. Leaf264]KQO96555.1 lactate 2-monooxygenase [Leifsonia sp. Leaf264]
MASAGEGFGRRVQSAIYRSGISGTRPAVPTTPEALELAAEKTLGREAFAYLAGGAGSETTVAANRAAFGNWRIYPRVLRDVGERDLSIELLGKRRATPFLLAPLGVMELAHPDADVAVGRAAAALDVPYLLSNQASRPMEEVAVAMDAVAPGRSRWFQLYWSASDELNASLVRRAEESGCEAIVVTLDTHLLGWRTRDLDLAYLPFTRGQGIAQYTSDPVFAGLVRDRVKKASRGTWAEQSIRVTPKAVATAIRMARNGSNTQVFAGGVAGAIRSPLPRAAVETFLDVFADPTLEWDALAKLREWTSLPIVLKGILHPDDAARALDHGVDGIMVSNHGGRQLDGAVASLDALPAVVDRVAGRVPVILDGGIRGGADAFIALALGATAVGIGRPYAYGLAVAGARGVSEVLRNHIAEFDITMGLAGHTAVAQIGRDSLVPSA